MGNTRIKIEKSLAIAARAMSAAETITDVLKGMPKTGKQGRNIFIKTYNRRPGNKRKRALILARAGIHSMFASLEIARIISMPIPKNESNSSNR